MTKKRKKKRAGGKQKDSIKSIHDISESRTGGAINIRGIGFQLCYSVFRILSELDSRHAEKEIRLEGVEDLDVIDTIEIDGTEYIQLKSSINTIDAARFWSMNVLQNFYTVHKINAQAKFILIYNFPIAKGRINNLFSKTLLQDDFNFWIDKFNEFEPAIDDLRLKEFISQISFERVDENQLWDKSKRLLIENYQISQDTAERYLNAVFYFAFKRATAREVIRQVDLAKVIQIVTDSFSKAPKNAAIEHNWIQEVFFDSNSVIGAQGYFDGKAARPEHISLKLPVDRNIWEEEINESINKFSTTVIKSSSGQGKSTLAWKTAKALVDNGYTAYELIRCVSSENSAAIYDFIQSRLSIGILPVIIVDGLSAKFSGWGSLTESMMNKGVKFIVTTREEDWYKYGVDVSRNRLKIIDIKLSRDEARDIFLKLKRANRIHSSVSNWQTIWEKIEHQGLLIEYVYLLTSGEMIKERIAEQVKVISSDSDSAAKLEILRLISIADVMNIKLKTRPLTKYIKDNIGFQKDRGEVFKQLQDEYYLNFSGQEVVGLHAVRSLHLVKELHRTIPVAESLVNLLPIIDEEFVYDYFNSFLDLVEESESKALLVELAEVLSERNFSTMVFAIDGLMSREASNYWVKNQSVFDRVFENGAIDLFIAETLPYGDYSFIESFAKTLGNRANNANFLLTEKSKLSTFNIDESDLVHFVRKLSETVAFSLNNKDIEGINFLVKWFHRLKVNTPKFSDLSVKTFDEYLEKDISKASEFFSFAIQCFPDEYKTYLDNNKHAILSYLKKETNSITITEIDNDIRVEYLLDSEVDKVNDFSVYRIQMIHSLLPIYEHYQTEAIILPFPNEDIYKAIVQNSTKNMPVANITNQFDIHVNQIWNKVIMRNYTSQSYYEWQECHIQLREQGLIFSKKCTIYFEARIANNSSRIKSLGLSLVKQVNNFLQLVRHRKKFPDFTIRYFEKAPFESERKVLDAWLNSISNFGNQLSSIVDPKTLNDRNVALINLRDSYNRLKNAQRAFDQITEKQAYFEVEDLNRTEVLSYDRLLKTVTYYIEHLNKPVVNGNINVVQFKIENWWKNIELKKLGELNAILENFQSESYYEFIAPNKIIHEGNLKKVVIGVDNLDLECLDDELLYLFSGLTDLCSLDIDFFYFVNVINKKAINAFSVSSDFILRLKKFLEMEEEFQESEYGNPLPLEVNDELIGSLDGVSLNNKSTGFTNDNFVRLIYDVWKLSEYRKRLNKESKVERDWLLQEEESFSKSIEELAKLITEDNIVKDLAKIQINDIYKFIGGSKELDKDQLVEILHEYSKRKLEYMNYYEGI